MGPLLASFGLVGVVLVVGLASAARSSEATPTRPQVSSFSSTQSSDRSAMSTSTAVAGTTEVPLRTVALERTLGRGMAGDDVTRVQRRLTDLGFDPGPIDGLYGTMTIQAVWAFEKLVLGVDRADATGSVTAEMWGRMQQPVTVAPRRDQPPGVNHVEIYLPEQVMVVFHGDAPVLVTHISSGLLDADGEPARYCDTVRVDSGPDGSPLPEPIEKPICGIAKTPGGIFDVDRAVSETRVGPLGAMWNPIYFNYGIAIHGAKNVPLEPASHGCIRIPMHISDYTQDLIEPGDNVWVWNGKKEPEQQTADEELPVFDWVDPARTPTTLAPAPTTTTPTATTTAPTATTTSSTSTSSTTTTTTMAAPLST